MSILYPTYADLTEEITRRADNANQMDAFWSEQFLVRELIHEIQRMRGLLGTYIPTTLITLCWGCHHPVAIHEKVHIKNYPMSSEPRRCAIDGDCDCTYIGGLISS